jgi:thiol-disulfide isomerase/thioredoxin
MKFLTMKVISVLFLLVLLGCSSNIDRDLYKVQLKELSGSPIDLSQYDGRTVFINFWATWCKPCIQEMPTIDEAQKLSQDVVFLIASNEDPDQIEKFIKRHDYNFHYVHLENMEALKIQALPTTFIFNSEGELKFSETGFRMWNDPANIELINSITNNHEK